MSGAQVQVWTRLYLYVLARTGRARRGGAEMRDRSLPNFLHSTGIASTQWAWCLPLLVDDGTKARCTWFAQTLVATADHRVTLWRLHTYDTEPVIAAD